SASVTPESWPASVVATLGSAAYTSETTVTAIAATANIQTRRIMAPPSTNLSMGIVPHLFPIRTTREATATALWKQHGGALPDTVSRGLRLATIVLAWENRTGFPHDPFALTSNHGELCERKRVRRYRLRVRT